MTDSIVILGVGNLSMHLIKALIHKGLNIVQIYNRNIDKVKNIIQENNYLCEITDEINNINKNADIYFFTLSDNVISEITDKIGKINGISIHCSGSVPISVFQKITNNYACFYPFQTFSNIEKYNINFSEIPIFIESNNKEAEKKLIELSLELNCKYYITDEKKRNNIHLSGIFASNFANHCIAIAQDILLENNISIDILNSLLEQSYKKLSIISAKEAQTGPARRNDFNIIDKHLSLLKNKISRYEIYKLLSKSIKEKYHTL